VLGNYLRSSIDALAGGRRSVAAGEYCSTGTCSRAAYLRPGLCAPGMDTWGADDLLKADDGSTTTPPRLHRWVETCVPWPTACRLTSANNRSHAINARQTATASGPARPVYGY
jgi:hypothetical protein